MLSLTLQKIPVSLSFIVTEIWPGQNINSKSGFLAKTSTITWLSTSTISWLSNKNKPKCVYPIEELCMISKWLNENCRRWCILQLLYTIPLFQKCKKNCTRSKNYPVVRKSTSQVDDFTLDTYFKMWKLSD